MDYTVIYADPEDAAESVSINCATATDVENQVAQAIRGSMAQDASLFSITVIMNFREGATVDPETTIEEVGTPIEQDSEDPDV